MSFDSVPSFHTNQQKGMPRRFSGLAMVIFTVALSMGRAAGAMPPTFAELDCIIVPDKVVELGSQVEGILEAVLVERGDVITKGQLLSRLKSDVERAGVALAKARVERQANRSALETELKFSQRRLQRLEDLFSKSAISDFEVDEAKTQSQQALFALKEAEERLRIDRVELERAEAALALREIYSPIDGVVVDTFLSVGERVDLDPVLKVARINPLRVEVIAPQSLFGKVSPGDEAQVYPEAPADGVFTVKVRTVDRVINPASGTFRIQLELPNPDFALPGGVSCRIDLGQGQ